MKTDSTGTCKYRYVYNAGGTALSAGMVVVLAPSANFTQYPRPDGTNERVQHVDHAYIIPCAHWDFANIGGVAIQAIEAGTCGWIQTDGYCDSVNLSSGDFSVDTVFPAGTTVGGGGAAMFGGPRRPGLGRLAAQWSPTHGTVSACPVFLHARSGGDHWHGEISAGFEGATHYLSGDVSLYGTLGITDWISAGTIVASVLISTYQTADMYVDDNLIVGGTMRLSSTDTDEGGYISAGLEVTRGVSAIDTLLSENIVVTDQMSATTSVSAEGFSANSWIDVGGSNFTVDANGATVSQTSITAVTNMTADNISATGSVSAEGFSANAWIDANALFTVDNAGAVVADNVGLVTNLTADNISATGSLSTEGVSCNDWLDVGGSVTIAGGITVYDISATGSISAEGFSANSWIDANGLFTVDNAGAVVADNVGLVTNLTADSISATGSVSAEGFSANAWLDVGGDATVYNLSATGSVSAEGFSANSWIDANGLFTVDNAGAVVADNVGLVTNLTADNISATGSVSAEGFSANAWLDVAGVVTSDSFGLSSAQHLLAEGNARVIGDIDSVYNMSATGSISAEGFSANSWMDVNALFTVDNAGAVVADNVGLVTNLTADNISATGSISAEGFSANSWIDVNSLFTVDNAGAVAADNLALTTNLTADFISATGSISAEGLSANDWINASGVIHGQSLEADGDAGATTAGITRFTADTAPTGGLPLSVIRPTVTGDWDINFTGAGPAASCIMVGIYVGTLKYVVPAFCCSA